MTPEQLAKIEDIQFDGIDRRDHPDYCDAYIMSATIDGEELTEDELEDLQHNHRDFVFEKLWDQLY